MHSPQNLKHIYIYIYIWLIITIIITAIVVVAVITIVIIIFEVKGTWRVRRRAHNDVVTWMWDHVLPLTPIPAE